MKVLIILATLFAVVASECSDNEFTCQNGNCIPWAYQCNANDDCGDYSDEGKHCPCGDLYFQCDDLSCIFGFFKCDNRFHCKNGEDEFMCPCDPGFVHCANNKECIPEEYWCDIGGFWDCSDGSDQTNCTVTSTTSTTTTTVTSRSPRRVREVNVLP